MWNVFAIACVPGGKISKISKSLKISRRRLASRTNREIGVDVERFEPGGQAMGGGIGGMDLQQMGSMSGSCSTSSNRSCTSHLIGQLCGRKAT